MINITKNCIELVLCSTRKFELIDKKELDFSYCVEKTLLNIESELLTIEQFASLYNVTSTTVKNWIAKTKLHGAVKVGDSWLIPELQPRPQKNKYMVQYGWRSLPAKILNKYPYLVHQSNLTIRKNSRTNMYECLLDDINRTEIKLNESERISLERALLQYADEIEDIRAVFVPY